MDDAWKRTQLMPFDFKCYRCNHLALENQHLLFCTRCSVQRWLMARARAKMNIRRRSRLIRAHINRIVAEDAKKKKRKEKMA